MPSGTMLDEAELVASAEPLRHELRVRCYRSRAAGALLPDAGVLTYARIC